MKSVLQHPPPTVVYRHHLKSLGNDTTARQCMNLILAEYVEMPGLSLTEAQVERLWSLSSDIAVTLLEELQRVHFLRRTNKGTYVRTDLGG